MSMHSVSVKCSSALVRSNEMKVGQFAVIRESSVRSYRNTLVIRTHQGFVSLSNPMLTWGEEVDFGVELVPKGTKIEIVIGI